LRNLKPLKLPTSSAKTAVRVSRNQMRASLKVLAVVVEANLFNQDLYTAL